MHRLLQPRFSYVHLTILLSLIIGSFLFFHRPNRALPSQAIRHQGSFKLTNPLIECEPDSFQSAPLYPLKNQITHLIDNLSQDSNIDTISVYFRNLNNGPWFGINQDQLFSPASLLKVPVMIGYYKLAQNDPGILDQKLTYIPTPTIEEPNILPKSTLTPNQSYTIQELIERMIIYSDNNAFSLLTTNLGPDKVATTFQDLDVDLTQTYRNPYGNNLSVRQYASFFRILYNASYLNPVMSEKALNLLTQIDYNLALAQPIPKDFPIAHKFGERSYSETGEKQLHDCGIVYLPQQPYLLCIMTRGKTEFPQLQNSIAKISQSVFEYFKAHNTPFALAN